MFQTLNITKQKPIVLALGWLFFFGGLAGLSYWNDRRTAANPEVASQDLQRASRAAQKSLPKYETKPIGEIRPIVDWVLADNPEITGDRDYIDDTGRYITDFGPLDPPNWRIVHFRFKKDDGSDLNIWLGRPIWYFKELGADEAGAKVWIDMAEFGAVGNADVVSIAQCPQPPPRPSDRHHLVTGRFVHSSSDFLRLIVEGVDEPIDATANHPFWSEDRQAFVEACNLFDGEQLRLAGGSTGKLGSSLSTTRKCFAFNIEVSVEHSYFISEHGVSVHNACLIGQNIPSRVRPVAKRNGYEWLRLPPSKWSWPKNERWLTTQADGVLAGKNKIYDISWQRGRYHGPNAIYTQERKLLDSLGLKKEPTGKWVQGDNGQWFRLYEWIPK